ncbi:MAG: hypothetical protein WA814_03000 [Candidatus Baltobacteraceae bacterium]
MDLSRIGLHSVVFCAAAMLISGCAGSQGAAGAPGLVLPAQRSAAGTRAGSWMLPGASSGELLYIVGDGGQIWVVSYPEGKLVGTLTNVEYPMGVCSDANGNVFVTAYHTEDVLEFAHGGTTPIAKLGDYGYYPNGCAVDPKTGNLAVANTNSMDDTGGNVAIYAGAQGKPTYYTGQYFNGFYWCAYDNLGNLLVDGWGGYGYAEMPAGSQTLNEFDMSVAGQGIQWDGSYFAIVNPSAKQVYRVSLNGSGGTVVSTITYKGLITSLGYDFVFAGSKVIMPYGIKRNNISKIAPSNYPQGRLGKPYHFGESDFYSITLSV